MGAQLEPEEWLEDEETTPRNIALHYLNSFFSNMESPEGKYIPHHEENVCYTLIIDEGDEHLVIERWEQIINELQSNI